MNNELAKKSIFSKNSNESSAVSSSQHVLNAANISKNWQFKFKHCKWSPLNVILLSLTVFLMQGIIAGPAACDDSNLPVLVTSATGTSASFQTTTQYIAYGDPYQKNPNASATNYYIRLVYGSGSGTFTDSCLGGAYGTGSTSYYVTTNCSFLTWNQAGTLNTTTSLAVNVGSSFSIYATPPANVSTTTTYKCNVTVGWSRLATWKNQTYSYNVVVQPCYVTTLAWATGSFTIANQIYSVWGTQIDIPASLVNQAPDCGFTVTYKLLKTGGLVTADSTVFTLTTGSTNTISIYTTNSAKASTTPYALTYNASISNIRDNTVKTLSVDFTVKINPCTFTISADAYSNKVYTIKSDATPATYTYPTFTVTPANACGFTQTNSITVNGLAFPGKNMNDGVTSMASKFTDTGTSFQISTTNLLDGTYTYNFVYKITFSNTPASTETVSFTVQLLNPCAQAVVQDSGQTIDISTTVLATPVYEFTFDAFKNSVAVARSDDTFCGGYTYTLSGYTGPFQLTINNSTRKLTLSSTSASDIGSYTAIKLVGKLTDHGTSTPYEKSIKITIGACVVTTFVLSSGSTAIAGRSDVTYQVNDAAQTLALPSYTQTPACGYTETKTCFIAPAGTVACPTSWLTQSATEWTIQTSSFTDVGTYSVLLKTVLNDTPPTSKVDSSLKVKIQDPCTAANGNSMIAGTTPEMTTSALSTTAQTQTLTPFKDTASNANSGNGYTLCGARSATLSPTKSFLVIDTATNVVTLSGTTLADIGTYHITVKYCLIKDSTVCASSTMTIKVTACEVTSLIAVPLPTQDKYVLDTSSTSVFTTITQDPQCQYSYTVTPSISGTTLSSTAFKGVTLTTVNQTLTYHSIDVTIVDVYTITWTIEMSSSCVGLCTISAPTTTLNWYHPCQKTVLQTPTVDSKTLTAMTSINWTFIQPTDSVSGNQTPNDGLTYCGARTYTFTPWPGWLQISSNTITVSSTSPTDYNASPYSITMTTSFAAYNQVTHTSTVFTVKINKCVVTSFTVSPTSLSSQTYTIGQAQFALAFPTYTQVPACAYTTTYTATYDSVTFTNFGPSLIDITSQTQFKFGYTTNLTLAQASKTIVLTATLDDPLSTSNSSITFPLTVDNPCLTTSWEAPTNKIMQTSLKLNFTENISVNDSKSVLYGDKSGLTLCGARSYSITGITKSGASVSPSFIILNTTTHAMDTLQVTPTVPAEQGTWVVTIQACLSFIPTCVSRTVSVVVDPCKVIDTTTTGNLIDQIYTSYVSSPVSFNIPTYAPYPDCGYTQLFQITATGTSTSTSYVSLQTTAQPYKYTINSTDTSHAGVYQMTLTMSFFNYPAQFDPYTDATVKWQITIVNPCVTTNVNGFGIFGDMQVFVLGDSQYQAFSDVTDSISQTYDSTTYTGARSGTVTAPLAPAGTLSSVIIAAPFRGTQVCGNRTYTTDCPYLTVGWEQKLSSVDITQTLIFPYLKLTSAADSEITSGSSCTITATLPAGRTTTQTVTVRILECQQTSLNQVGANPAMQSYVMMGTQLTVPFSSYSKIPACSYEITYTLQAMAWDQAAYPTGTATPVISSASTIVSIPALNSMVNFDTINKQITVYFAPVTDLTSYQYQGDYAIQVTATTLLSKPTSLTNSNFFFILRIINPCTDTAALLTSAYFPSGATIPSLTRNTLSPVAITPSRIDTSVLAASQSASFQEFLDLTSQNTTYGGSVNSYSLCGEREYQNLNSTQSSFLTINPSPNNNQIVVYSSSNNDIIWTTYNQVIGCHTVLINSKLKTYPNITTSQSFTVCIEPCKPTAFNADTIADQTYTISVSPTLIVPVPPYYIEPACAGLQIAYTAKIEKTAVQSVARTSTYPIFPQTNLGNSGFIVDSTTYPAIAFNVSQAKTYISTINLDYGGTYKITITAVLQELYWYRTSTIPNFYTNSSLNYTQTIVDPCITTLVNNLPNSSDNVVIKDLFTSVKFGQTGSASPFTYSVNPTGTQTFVTFRDSVSQIYGPSGQSGTVSSDYCGPRDYTLGGDNNPAWLALDTTTGTLTVATTNDLYVKTTGYVVTLKACLRYYTGVCSTEVSFKVYIYECKIVDGGFTNTSLQPNITQKIFYPVQNVPLVTYKQVPECGWKIDFNSSVYQNNSNDFTTQESPHPSWAILNDAVTVPRWEIFANSKTDAKNEPTYTYRVNYTAKLNDTYIGIAQNTNITISFYVTLINPCYQVGIANNALVSQRTTSSPAGKFSQDYNQAFAEKPLMTASVKFGTDLNLSGAGTPVNLTFPWHADLTSTELNSNTAPTSGWKCGYRSYSLTIHNQNTVLNPLQTTFITFVNSSAPDLPILRLMTSSDADIGKWVIKMQVKLEDYPLVTINEFFSVQIESCLLNSLKLDVNNTAYPNPITFSLYKKTAHQQNLPTYTQAPACGYPLYYEVNLLQQWDIALTPPALVNSIDTPAPSFVSLDTTLNPKVMKFKSDNWTDDRCIYGNTANPVDYKVCMPANMNPYKLQLRAFINKTATLPVLFNPNSITFSNSENEFKVWPIDPCHNATLKSFQVPNITYFLTDKKLYLAKPTGAMEAFEFVETNITQDSISLNTTEYDSQNNTLGYELCGNNSYQVFNSALNVADYATVTFEPPRIVIKTDNDGFIGVQQSYLQTNLVNYKNITASVPFYVFIYSFNLGKPIIDQHYTIGDKMKIIEWKPFTISPDNTANTFEIYYNCSIRYTDGTLFNKNFIKIDRGERKIEVFSKTLEDAGVYNITIQGNIVGYEFATKQYILLNVTKTPPPPQSIPVPYFTNKLQNKEIYAGDSLNYFLGGITDPNDKPVTADLTDAPKWVSFDDKQYRISVLQGSTDAKTAEKLGKSYPVKITLQNTAGGKATYSFTITVKPVVVLAVEKQIIAQADYPVPTIQSITSKGIVTINWSQNMRVQRNLTMIQNGTSDWTDPQGKVYLKKPNIDIQVLPSPNSYGNDLSFTWNLTSFKPTTITIQLFFNNSLEVSQGKPPDNLQIIFYGSKYFTSAKGIPVNGGPDPNVNPVLVKDIPPQQLLNKVKSVRRNNKAGMSTGDVPEMIFQLSISTLLSEVWGMVDTQQIIILIPLFKLVLPDNAAAFFSYLFQIAAFAIIPTDPIFGAMFAIDPLNLPNSINDNFAAVGFGTTIFSFNIGTLFFALMYFPVMVFVALFLKLFRGYRYMVEQRIKIERKLYWNGTIGVIETSYTVLCICCFCQQTQLEWNSGAGPWVNSFMGLFYLVVVIALPFVQAIFSWYYYELIKSEDQKFILRFGNFWDGFRVDDRGFIPYNFYFLVRRFMIGYLCVYCKDTLFYQVAGLVFNVILATILTGEVSAYEDPRLNRLDFFNETMIMMVMYCMICFTDFLPDKDTQSNMGIVVQVFVVFHIVFNLSFVFGDYLYNLRLRYARWKLSRQHAKSRGMQNLRIKQKQRMQKSIKQTKEMLQKYEQQLKRNLNPIQEVAESGDGESNIQNSYEYALAHNNKENQSAISIDSIEDSGNNLNNGNHFEKNKQLFDRKPVDAPEVQKHVMREFADQCLTSDFAQNAKLGQSKPVEFARDMEQQVHAKLFQRIPFDSIQPDLQAILSNEEPEEFKLNSFQQQIQHSIVEKPINIVQNIDPNKLIHNKIARMAGQDVHFLKSKVQPEPLDNRLKIMADKDLIHGKLFVQHEAGDGPKQTSTEAYNQLMINSSKRKPIVPITPNAKINSSLDYPHIEKPLIPIPPSSSTKNSRFRQEYRSNATNLEDLIKDEEEEKEIELQKAQKQEEINELVRELTGDQEKNSMRKQKIGQRQQSDQQTAYDVHVRLFGPKAGKNRNNTNSFSQQDEWKLNTKQLSKQPSFTKSEGGKPLDAFRGNSGPQKQKSNEQSFSDGDFELDGMNANENM